MIREKNLFRNVKDEVQIMFDLIGVAGVCQMDDIVIKGNSEVSIVLPFYPLTDLWNFMRSQPSKHLSEAQSKTIFRQLVDIFISIHARHIMHRDLKPENILIKDEKTLEICLTDFGLAARTGPFPNFQSTRTG